MGYLEGRARRTLVVKDGPRASSGAASPSPDEIEVFDLTEGGRLLLVLRSGRRRFLHLIEPSGLSRRIDARLTSRDGDALLSGGFAVLRAAGASTAMVTWRWST